MSLEDYLETKSTNNGDDDKKEKNRKQVRWKDFEEDKKLNKIKELGFIVGQTAEDWKKLMGDYKSTSGDALISYKYF